MIRWRIVESLRRSDRFSEPRSYDNNVKVPVVHNYNGRWQGTQTQGAHWRNTGVCTVINGLLNRDHDRRSGSPDLHLPALNSLFSSKKFQLLDFWNLQSLPLPLSLLSPSSKWPNQIRKEIKKSSQPPPRLTRRLHPRRLL